MLQRKKMQNGNSTKIGRGLGLALDAVALQAEEPVIRAAAVAEEEASVAAM
jgi:hypothetical protein